MSAAIHPFPGRDPNVALLDADDTLLAELAAAVGSAPRVAGGTTTAPSSRRDSAPNPNRDPATVHPIAAARRGGANDLVAAEPLVGAARRRHHVALAAVTVVLALAMALVGGMLRAATDGDVAIAGSTTMEGGDTLWGIATEITPVGGDVRETVALLLEVNDFDSPTVPVGTRVVLPQVAG